MNAIANLSGYQITEQLYTGTRTLVYRGIRTSDQHPVAIKLLRNEYPNFTELVQFRNQYTIAKNLDFPSIIKPLTLEAYHNSYALVMEDFGGISLSAYLQVATDQNQPAKSLSLAEFLNLGIQLTDILNYLSQNRVIHKDIKPANILINPDTKQIKLIDFSISSLLPRETQEIQNLNVLEGTLAYLSPEQTGRMNRGIDYRSDFYALGVTFYQLLTGQLPFISDDAMELVHCHLAKQSIPIHQINSKIPIFLSHMVSKLMAKNAEDRYQSALGIKHDLEICLAQLEKTGNINIFELGQRDITDRFLIPEKLYGREIEVDRLLAAFERVATPPESHRSSGGHRGGEMMLVAGFSGIGKTAVVNEVHKPIVRQRGYFIKGKYDQFQRNIPFSAFVQAFRDLMGQLLSESDTQLQIWKSKILTAVGDNGQVLIDVIPELERIIGKQQIAPELSGSAAQNRFNLLMQKFVQIFTQAEHPLVMFLDDLQWADSASLKLLQLLMEDTGHLLVLGAYRDNEVSPTHPFIMTLEEIQKTGATVNIITLAPLQKDDINQLISDTLSCEPEIAKPLRKLVYQKTQGNPFFATQFLKALYDDGLITFDPPQSPTRSGSPLSRGRVKEGRQGGWECDIAQVKALALTDDVVEFMALQLQKLPIETQEMLKLAACIGAQFDLATLAIVSEKSPEVAATALWKALQEGLVIPTTKIYKFFTQSDSDEVFKASANPTYRFLHDRVQQAAYCLIAPAKKQTTHLYIGTLLLQNFSLAEREERIFEIVNHLNIAKTLITQASQQEELAQLNLLAGIKAKASTAYSGAFAYISAAMELLPPDCWEKYYDISLALFKERAELEYLNGNFQQAECWLQEALEKSKSPLEKAEIYNMAIAQYTMQAKYPQAIQAGRQALALVDIYLPEEDFDTVRDAELALVQEKLKNRLFSDLLDLPIMTQIEPKMAIKLLISMGPPTYRSHQRLWSVICAKAVNLCLEYGNTPEIGYIYPAFGGLRGYALNNYQGTDELLNVTLQLMQTFNNKSAESVAYLMIGSSLRHWSHPLKIASEDYLSSYRVGLESSNLQYAAYAFGHNMYCRFYQSIFLEQLFDEITESLAFSQKYKNQWAIDMFLGGQIILAEFMGITVNLSESNYLEQCRQHKNWQVICIYNILKSQLLFIYERLEEAFYYGEQADAEIVNVAPQGLLPYVHHCFIYALLLITRYPTLPDQQKQSCWEKISMYQQKLEICSQNNPINFLHLYCLVNAEIDRVFGDFLKAIENYDRAISEAKANGYIQEEAIANELVAKFYLDWGKEKVAQVYMIDAYYCYARWGAKAKVIDLEKRYPQLLASILQQPHVAADSFKETSARRTIVSSHTSSSTSEVLDLATILKASQVISGGMELDKLLTTLLQIVITNAGASKCVLLLKQDIELQVAAFVEEGQEPQLLPPMPLESSQDVAIALVNTVKRSLKPLVLVDARVNPEFSGDRYIAQHQPKSVLCSPILNQGKLIGILYLENNLTVGAFTSDRVELLNLLCSQAAISLENARLYQQSQQALAELRASEARFQKMADNIPGMVFQFLLAADGTTSMPYASSGCLDLYEAQPEKVMAGIVNVFAAVDPDDLPGMEQAIAESAQNLTQFNYEWRNATPSGTMKWMQTISQPERRADGSTLWDGVVFDVSERKRSEAEYKAAETALQISEQNLRTIFNNVSSAILIHDLDGKLLDVNNRVLEMFGVDREQALQYSILNDYSTPDNPFHLVEDWWKRVLAGETIQFEWSVRKIDSGTVFEVYVTLNRIVLDGKSVILANILDISDRKRAEAERQQKSEALEKTLRKLQQAQIQLIQGEKMSALGNLVAGVAHEINNPVGFLTGNITPALDYINDLFGLIELVQQKYPQLDPEIQEEIETIELDYIREDLPRLVESMREGVKRIQDISNSLRTFSRADSDRPLACNIHDGIDSTIMILKHRLKANDTRPEIQVIKNYGNLPPIKCYAGQLNQVFMNILANAIDALDESNMGRSYAELKVNPNQITIQTAIEGEGVKIAISDNGSGIPEHLKNRIFEHLFTTKSVGKGTGLGLAIARQIVVDKHGGAIEVKSTLGVGTEFIIILPT